MRILLTLDAVGGVWQYGMDLARGLVARGVEPVLAVLGPAPDAGQRAEASRIEGARVVETGLALDWLSEGPEPVLAAGAAIATLARDEHADLVQFNMPTLGAATPPPVPVIAVTHGCVGTWWEAAKRGEALDPAYHWHRDLMGEGLRSADRLVAPTHSYARTIQRLYALPDTPQVVHNGRTVLVEGAGDQPMRGEPTGGVLTVGRLWDRVKRADLLDAVAARIGAPFAAAGAAIGPHGERAELHHLRLLGQLDAAGLGAELAKQPVFVSAASFEPFGLAVLEAAQAGCALVLSDIDSFRELWDGAAAFVPPDDKAAYVGAIEQLLHDPAERRRLGEAARQRAGRYSPQAMADAMLAIYADALAEGTCSGRVAA
ncbi:glycosyltransferase family 4 protein [Novosphingobium soli]|uniref:Glycosyltransferase family 4 protein n=1 Tax=Novosphingobium soli TaxID=574956 RepID=A0ABV6CZN4_9SPHN